MRLIDAINIFYNFLIKTKDEEIIYLPEDFIEARKIINDIDPNVAKALANEALN